MLSDDNLDQVRTMTVGELFDVFAPSMGNNACTWEKMEKILAKILSEAEEIYHDRVGFEFDIRSIALSIAAFAFAADGIDKNTAANMAHEMALLAYAILHAEEAGEWDHSIHEALNKIRRSDPVVKRAAVPDYGPESPIPF